MEGLGIATGGRLRVFNVSGQNVKDVLFFLRPFEFQQIDAFLAANGVSMDDARIDVEIDSGAGAVTTYASVLDNRIQAPLCVSPTRTSALQSNRYVLPGANGKLAITEATLHLHTIFTLFRWQ